MKLEKDLPSSMPTCIALGLAWMLFMAGYAAGAEIRWDGEASPLWSNPANWNPNTVPTAADMAYVDHISGRPDTVIDAATEAVCQYLRIGAWNYNGSLTMTGGKLTVAGDYHYLMVGEGGKTARLDLTTSHPVIVMPHCGRFIVGYTGAYGTVNMTAGEIQGTWVQVGLGGDYVGQSRGLFLLGEKPSGCGTALKLIGNLEIGVREGTYGSTGTLIVNQGATISAANLIVGKGRNCTGVLNQGGWSQAEIASKIRIGVESGTGEVNLSGGTLAADSLEIGAGGRLNITGGLLILRGDQRAALAACQAGGKITPTTGLAIRITNTGQTLIGSPTHTIFLPAWDPAPDRGASVSGDLAVILSWKAGQGAQSHDVYFGTDKISVQNATRASAEYRGNQTATTYPASGMVNQTYYWRIDEVGSSAVTPGEVWSFTRTARFGELTFDRRNGGRKADGFGAYVWPGDSEIESLFQELKFQYIQVQLCGTGDMSAKYSGGSQIADFNAFWTDPGEGAQFASMKTTWTIAHRNGMEVVLQCFNPPYAWCSNWQGSDRMHHVFLRQNSGRPANENIERFANMIVSALETFGSTDFSPAYPGRKMRPPYLILFGELDGDWGCHVPPDIYRDVLATVRQRMNDHGFADVKIVGPGVSNIDGALFPPDGSGDRYPGAHDYIDALNPANLDIWGNETNEFWTNVVNAEGGQSYVRDRWINLQTPINAKDPKGLKPIWDTSFETFASVYHGKSFLPYWIATDWGTVDTVMFGSRLFENCTSILNCGASVGLIWEAAEPGWDPERSALTRKAQQGSARRPGYWALRTWLPRLPLGGTVLSAPPQANGDLYVHAVDKDGTMVFAIANNTPERRTKRIKINHVPGQGEAFIAEAWAYQKKFETPEDPTYDRAWYGQTLRRNLVLRDLGYGVQTVDTWLPADSVMTFVLKYPVPSLVGLWAMDDLGTTTTVKNLDAFVTSGHGILSDAGGSPGANALAHHAKGQRGGALIFDGVDDHVVVPALNTPLSSATMAAWIYPSAATQPDGAGLIYGGCGLVVRNNHLACRWNGNLYESNFSLANGQWVFVALTVTPQGIQTFMADTQNGLRVDAHALSTAAEAMNAPLWFGRGEGGAYFKGAIDDVRLYNRALTLDEIEDLFKRGEGVASLAPADWSGAHGDWRLY